MLYEFFSKTYVELIERFSDRCWHILLFNDTLKVYKTSKCQRHFRSTVYHITNGTIAQHWRNNHFFHSFNWEHNIEKADAPYLAKFNKAECHILKHMNQWKTYVNKHKKTNAFAFCSLDDQKNMIYFYISQFILLFLFGPKIKYPL